jgi:hypothetical protein
MEAPDGPCMCSSSQGRLAAAETSTARCGVAPLCCLSLFSLQRIALLGSDPARQWWLLCKLLAGQLAGRGAHALLGQVLQTAQVLANLFVLTLCT